MNLISIFPGRGRVTLSLCLACARLSGSASATIITLYDDSQGNLPGDQPWVGYFALGGVATQTANAQGVQLQTDQPVGAGYSNHQPTSLPFAPALVNNAFPSLDDSVGYSLSFEMQLLSESHFSDDRAGFSVIALGSDGRGIELAFWEDRVFAQSDSPLFTHAEEGLFDTTASERDYVLTVQNNAYSLAADTQTILTGALRDYSAFNGTPFGVPYSLSNYIFLGDDTSSALATVNLGSIVLNSDISVIPEPTSAAALMATACGVVLFRRRRGG